MNPDAMLPFMEYERAFVMMALGCPFMAASTVSVIWAYGLSKTEHAWRKLVLLSLPAAVDALPLLFLVGVLAVMLVKGIMEAAELLTLLL